ncbi:IS66 family transposase [Vibrio natriegens]|uniref:IS66 family transposase n=1 Tax=Vibrio natriegens TaxID=691 RepID=UPI001EFE4D62|nr:IS66 family transposase [Vibrio natriegens]MCG9702975.1 IS66 family transposase [Vibrio natriegens]
MKTKSLSPNTLPDSQDYIDNLEAQNAVLMTERDDFKRRYYQVLEELRLARHHRFGASSEVDSEQGELFDIDEVSVDSESEEPSTQPHSAPKAKPARQPLPEALPRVVIRHEPEHTQCPDCGDALHCIGEDISEKLVFVPAKVEVEQHIRPKCICCQCEQRLGEVTVHQAPMPATVFPKSIATSSLVAQMVAMKFHHGLPLTRVASLLATWDITISRRTIADWVIQASTILEPVWEHLRAALLQQSWLHADETPVKVIGSDKSKTYMWVYCSGSDGPEPPPYDKHTRNIVLYDHQMGRSGCHATQFLSGYEGYLHVDGYQGYHDTAATLVGCWAHARRKFIEAQKVQGNDEGGVRTALTHIKKLYRTESLLNEGHKTAEERHEERQSTSKNELTKFKKWLDKTALRVPKKSALGKAVHYTLGQWDKLVRYIDDGHLNIDNNRGERAIRPFVVGRKAWLFNKSERGARSSCILYSLVETAKANGLVPADYLTYCFDRLATAPDDLDALLPWNVK